MRFCGHCILDFFRTRLLLSMDVKATQQNESDLIVRIYFMHKLIEKKLVSPPWSAYFDTPILSGRTRSKNKPSEEETAAGTGTASTPSLGDAHAPSSVAHIAASSTITLTGHSMGVSKHADQGAAANPDVPGTGGKRSTRSVRTKGDESK